MLDNYATHNASEGLARSTSAFPFHCHFTPTSASWLNLVERFFAEISRKRIRRGTFGGVDELEAAICDYLDRHNADPKPFMWIKTAETILAKERRALEKLQNLTGCQPTGQSTSGLG